MQLVTRRSSNPCKENYWAKEIMNLTTLNYYVKSKIGVSNYQNMSKLTLLLQAVINIYN